MRLHMEGSACVENLKVKGDGAYPEVRKMKVIEINRRQGAQRREAQINAEAPA